MDDLQEKNNGKRGMNTEGEMALKKERERRRVGAKENKSQEENE